MADKPTVLLTNDDGIDSFFLRCLLDGLRPDFDVFVAAPAQEQSWVSRAMTRNGDVSVHKLEDWPCPAWAVGGTPSDCVNIALHHLLPQRPDYVVSGINVGYNVSRSLILGSGTVGAALEGAFAGIDSFAFSMAVPEHEFEYLKANHGQARGDYAQAVRCAGVRAAALLQPLSAAEKQRAQCRVLVHNINFPCNVNMDTPVEEVGVSDFQVGSLFAAKEKSKAGESHYYAFAFPKLDLDFSHPKDLERVKQGALTYSRLDYSNIA